MKTVRKIRFKKQSGVEVKIRSRGAVIRAPRRELLFKIFGLRNKFERATARALGGATRGRPDNRF